jgi:iron-sulfur cluster assembly accessory protein
MTTIGLTHWGSKSEGSDDVALLGEVPCDVVEATGFPIVLSDKAVEMVKAALQETEAEDGQVLRVGVRGGGCAGFEYSLNFTNELEDDDVATVTRGVKVVTDAFSASYLEGTELDYVETLQGAGFKFINPNARRTCGCGSSFS